MRKTRTIFAAVVTGSISCFTTLRADSASPNFWDEIPVSPSTRAAKVIKTLQSKNKTMKIVLAKIIPVQGKIEEVNLLNRLIAQYIKAHSTVQSPIVMADQNTGFNTSTDLADGGVLPSAIGAKKMAAVFAGAMNELLSNTPKK